VTRLPIAALAVAAAALLVLAGLMPETRENASSQQGRSPASDDPVVGLLPGRRAVDLADPADRDAVAEHLTADHPVAGTTRSGMTGAQGDACPAVGGGVP
jgi:hypothetical protein